MLDSFKRNIDYARISITDNCNLFCKYCRANEENSNQKQLSSSHFFNLIDVLDELGFRKIRFTGGEPLLNKNIVEYIKYANDKKNITDISITTNGVMLDKYLKVMKEAGLKRINISLDTLKSEKYLKMTFADCFKRVLANIYQAKEIGFDIKINVVVMKEFNVDEINDFIKFGCDNNILVRFIELMSIGNNEEFVKRNYYEMKDFIKRGDYQKIVLDKRDVADYYKDETGYIFGVISPMSNHFCERCNRIRFTNNGMLRMCLHSDYQIDLNSCFNDKKQLKELLIKSIVKKPRKHMLSKNVVSCCNMSKIGG